MSQQNYHNHKRYYAPHHFVLLPALFFSVIFSIYKAWSDEQNRLLWILFGIAIFFILYATVMMRQHYALGNQNRIVVLEFRERYFEMFGKRSEPIVAKLNFAQISALRFAPDDEFEELLNRALNENLSGDDIKKNINNWKADNHRV